MTPVPLKTELMQTTVLLEDTRESSLKRDLGERISLTEEVGHRQEEVRTYEREVESIVREERTLKKEIKQQMVVAKDEGEPACTEHEVESKRDVTPPPEITRPKKEVSVLTSKKEVLTYKKTPQERKLKEADIPSTYTEQKEVTEPNVSVHHEEIETVSPMEDLVKPKISATSKEVTVPKKPRVPKEVTLLKQADSVEVEDVQSDRSIPRRETVSLPPEQDLPQILPKTTLSRPMTAVPSKKEVITPKKMEPPREEITTTPQAEGKIYLEDIVPLEKPTPVSVSFEELVPATRLIPASKEVSPPVPPGIPSPEKIVCLEEEISSLKETVLPIKKTSPALPKAVVAPKEDFPTEKVTLPKKIITKDNVAPTKKSQVPPQKKPLSPEEETLPSKTPEEVRTTATKPQPIGEDDKKVKKGTREIEQQTLQKGILSYLSCTGP